MPIIDTTSLSNFWSPASVSSNIVLLMHLFGSMLLGMLVGYERSYHGRAAGMRTFSLVCMGSTALVATFAHPDIWFGGLYIAAIALALLCAFSMSIVLQLERWLPKQRRYYFELSYAYDTHPDSGALERLAAQFGLLLRLDTVSFSLSKTHQICSFTATSGPHNHTNISGLARALQTIDGLEAFSITPTRN